MTRLVLMDKELAYNEDAGFAWEHKLHVYEGRQRIASFENDPEAETQRSDVEWARTADHSAKATNAAQES